MNRAVVDRIASALLYEGYILYPYRPSVKNRQRWTFGGLYPRAWCEAQEGADAWTMQTECLVVGSREARLEIRVRFLHLMARTVGELTHALAELPEGTEPAFRAVDKLQVGDKIWQTWQEAVEREIAPDIVELNELVQQPRHVKFSFPARRQWGPLRSSEGEIIGVLVREQQAVEGMLQLSAEQVGKELFKASVKIVNQTPLDGAGSASRDDALLRSLVSTHTILGARSGEFVSLLDPPGTLRELAAGCRNEGTWPVLVGDPGDKDTMLSSPIILYDYPQIAPESPGDLFDATEIDEILTLRILSLTEEEKQAMAAVDERARALLQRTESLAQEQLLGLHGTMRGLQEQRTEDGREKLGPAG
jgi:hydrogenase maturation protease